MELKSLKAKNVFRFDEIEVNFKETTLIIASTNGDFEKSNSVGKSAIVELVFFGLFGKLLRDDFEISKHNSGNYYVEVCIDNMKIVRTEKQTLLYMDNQEVVGRKKEIQQMINNYIGLNSEIYKYAGIFTTFTSFFGLSDSQKKDLLLSILNINFLDLVYDEIKEDVDKLKENNVEILIEKYTEETQGFEESK